MTRLNKAVAAFTTVLLAAAVFGCESSSNSTGGGASMDDLAAQVSAQRSTEQAQKDKAAEDAAAKDASQQPAEAERKVAQRGSAGEGGYYTAIVGARRHVLNRVDDLAWTQAVQHFQAEHGRLPKDHAEFMKEIVERHGIDLGYKGENEEFLYDPSQGQWGEVYLVEKLNEPAQAEQ